MANNHIYAYAIKNQWLNMSLYFINFMYNTSKPFADTLVGKILKSKAFKYGFYTLKTGPSFLVTPLLLKTYAIGKLEEFTGIYGNFVNDGKNVCGYITTPDRLKDNNEPLGGREKNTKWLANGDFIKTDFILLDKTDIISFFENPDSGFSIKKDNLNSPNNYKRHTTNNGSQNITNQERENDDSNSNNKNNNNILYFLKGTNGNDIITYTISTNVI
jgi:hypothetical protein